MAEADVEERSYGGLLGSFRYSFGASESYVYKGYVLVSAALGLVLTLLFTFALIGVIAATLGASETITLVRSFFVLVALLVIAPIVAPVLLVARRHRTRRGDDTYDAALAVGGYLFIAALYIGLVISVPPEHREATTGGIGAVVEVLYGLPGALGILPPVVAVVAIVLLHRRFR